MSILRIHSRKMSLQRGIDLKALAEKMGQCSGAEVRGICTEAGACVVVSDILSDCQCRDVRTTGATTARDAGGL